MMVAQLTTQQAELLTGVRYADGCYFNPIKDADGDYFISLEEVQATDIEWVKSLPLKNYNPTLITLDNG